VGVILMVIAMIADEFQENRGEEHEDKRLDQAD
jgi:hypothetical protein